MRAWTVWRTGEDAAARRLFAFSIVYLFLIFALLVADHWLAAARLGA
jgi:protoheme IX farnesyltransferase